MRESGQLYGEPTERTAVGPPQALRGFVRSVETSSRPERRRQTPQKTQLCIPASPHPRTGTPATAMCYFLMPPLPPLPPDPPPASPARHRIPANSADIDRRIPAPPHPQIRTRRRAAVAGGGGWGKEEGQLGGAGVAGLRGCN